MRVDPLFPLPLFKEEQRSLTLTKRKVKIGSLVVCQFPTVGYARITPQTGGSRCPGSCSDETFIDPGHGFQPQIQSGTVSSPERRA